MRLNLNELLNGTEQAVCYNSSSRHNSKALLSTVNIVGLLRTVRQAGIKNRTSRRFHSYCLVIPNGAPAVIQDATLHMTVSVKNPRISIYIILLRPFYDTPRFNGRPGINGQCVIIFRALFMPFLYAANGKSHLVFGIS